VIQEHIKKPLADELLFGQLVKGGHVLVKVEDDKLAFEFTADKGGPDKSGKGGTDGSAGGKVPEYAH
jgi:ATP-dependent Clp protease ATP-binding subunit ClpA